MLVFLCLLPFEIYLPSRDINIASREFEEEFIQMTFNQHGVGAPFLLVMEGEFVHDSAEVNNNKTEFSFYSTRYLNLIIPRVTFSQTFPPNTDD